jgi:hypothetical protein
MTNYDVISAFLDNEPFDANELAHALADPDGRALLIDLVALRGVVQPEPAPVSVSARQRPWLRMAMTAAGLVLAVGAGYQIGADAGGSPAAPPEPTRVIAADTPWQDAR